MLTLEPELTEFLSHYGWQSGSETFRGDGVTERATSSSRSHCSQGSAFPGPVGIIMRTSTGPRGLR